MDDIKSAFEIAMEKVNNLDEPTEEERLTWKHVPEGEKLAARYLKQKLNLSAELNKYDENIRKYVVNGASCVLARNISLPKNDYAKQTNKKAMEGLKLIKSDKVGVENIFSKIRYIFNHYAEQGEQQKKQAYESLKTELGERIQQAMQQQLGTLTGVKIDVEQQPQFQQEWRKLQTQIDSQYISHLNEYIRELIEIA